MITELYIDGSLVDLEKQETIVLTKSVFDINKFSVRSSDFSNVFKVPKTQQNRLIFKSAGIVNSFNDEPYDQLSASIKIDGVEVAVGVAELQSSDEDYYSISVQAGNGAFFKAIKALYLTDLSNDLATLDHEYSPAEVSARRDVAAGLVYPNVDYGWFERASTGSQPFRYFYPALYVKFIIDKAIEQLGYKRLGSFWEGLNYSSLAIMAKNIVSDADTYFVSYSANYGVDFFTVDRGGTETLSNGFRVFSVLNFSNENSDEDELYVDTALGLGYVTFGYNFPVNIGNTTTFVLNFNGNVNISQGVRGSFRNGFIINADVVFRLAIYNKVTDTFVSNAVEFSYNFYEADYDLEDQGQFDELVLKSERLETQATISSADNTLSSLSSIAATATDHALVWFVDIITETHPDAERISTVDVLADLAVDVEFDLTQTSGGDPNQVTVINSFDDISIGSLFLYVCNVFGVFPSVDEGLKTVSMISFDSIKRNKAQAINWSKKIDLSTEPEVSFKLDYAKNNIFEYANDDKDVFLNELTNYGRGTFVVDNENMNQEVVKYRSPFSLCAIAPTFNETRSMGRIFTGDKYIFNGVTYEVDSGAKVEGFTTRVVSLSRTTDNLIQVSGGSTVTGNYEVNNTPILFDYVVRTRYSIVNDILNKTKVVNALIRLNEVDFRTFDFTKPVFIDYLNDYFIVNDIKQFKANEVDSTNVTLIRI